MQDDEGLFGGAVLSCELHDEHQKQHSVDDEHRRRRRRRARRCSRGRFSAAWLDSRFDCRHPERVEFFHNGRSAKQQSLKCSIHLSTHSLNGARTFRDGSAAHKIWNSPASSPNALQLQTPSPSSPRNPRFSAALQTHLTPLFLRLRFGFCWPPWASRQWLIDCYDGQPQKLRVLRTLWFQQIATWGLDINRICFK